MRKIYLDNAASTIVDERVIESIVKSLEEDLGNPSSIHSYGQEAKAKIETVRKFIAKSLSVAPNEIIFTSGGTESNNLILRSCVDNLEIKRIISSPLEHKAVLETIRDIKEKHPQVEIIFLPVNKQTGEINLEVLEEYLEDEVGLTLVSLMHGNNEIGNLLNLQDIANLCKKYNALFHSDTVQTIGHYPLDFSKILVDFASCSAHKFHGPKGIGVAYIRKSNKLKAIITGGLQERGLRSGTENVSGIVGLGKAFELSLLEFEKRKQYIENLKLYAIEQIQTYIPGVKINGNSLDISKSLYTLINISLPFPNHMIGFQLNIKGIAISQGSACSSGAAKPSHVMLQLNTEEELKKLTVLRISFSHYNTKEDVDELINALVEIQEKS